MLFLVLPDGRTVSLKEQVQGYLDGDDATVLSKVGFKVLVRTALGCGAPPPPGDPAHGSAREVLSRVLSYTLMAWVLLDLVPMMCGAGGAAAEH